MNKIVGGGNYILTALRRSVLLFALTVSGLLAQTAILECVSAADYAGRLRLTFRTAVAEKFKVQRATLLLHLKDSGAPQSLKVNGRSAPVVSREKDWITVSVPSKDALKPLVVERGSAHFHGCSPPQFAPYLVIEGPSTRQEK